MGEVAMIGDFARGLASPQTWRRLYGWRRVVVFTGVGLLALFVVLIGATVLGPGIVDFLAQ